MVGGGLGDIEEVLAAGRRLAADGHRIVLYRRPEHPLPRSVDGPWAWPRIERAKRLRPRSSAAITITPAWGISAAPRREGPLGREGSWAVEGADIERAYGAGRTIHLSLEEFARTLTSRAETRERFREGGVGARALSRRLRAAEGAREVAAYSSAFERFRAFERPNVLHLFATFRPSAAFQKEFPRAVQTGPLWSALHPYRGRRAAEWVWYASPASAERIADAVVDGLTAAGRRVRLFIRTPRPWKPHPFPGWVRVTTAPLPASAWRRRFARAELRIVTGSRTLLEAIEVGGPFLYFNGILGEGSRARRHRPEKIDALLELARRRRVAPDLVRDLGDFARGRRTRAIVERAARRSGGWARFPRALASSEFRPPYNDAGALVAAVAGALARSPDRAVEIVGAVRAGLHP